MAMKTCAYCLATAALWTGLALHGMAAAKEPLRLQPSSKWNVHYGNDNCRMTRVFGEGDKQVAFIADRYRPSDSLRISFVGKPTRTNLNEGNIRLRFGPTEAEQDVAFFPATMDDKTPAIVLRNSVRIAVRSEAEVAAYEAALKAGQYLFQWSDITPEQEAGVTFIEVKGAIHEPFVLETGSLGPPLEALRKCTDELLTHWGIDVAKHRGLSRHVTPKSDPRRWVTSGDYPAAMAAMGKRAIVQFRLNVDAAGSPTSCHIQQSTRPKSFDDAVCAAILRRARFEPALDADGAPIASYWINSVTFII